MLAPPLEGRPEAAQHGATGVDSGSVTRPVERALRIIMSRGEHLRRDGFLWSGSTLDFGLQREPQSSSALAPSVNEWVQWQLVGARLFVSRCVSIYGPELIRDLRSRFVDIKHTTRPSPIFRRTSYCDLIIFRDQTPLGMRILLLPCLVSFMWGI